MAVTEFHLSSNPRAIVAHRFAEAVIQRAAEVDKSFALIPTYWQFFEVYDTLYNCPAYRLHVRVYQHIVVIEEPVTLETNHWEWSKRAGDELACKALLIKP